MIWEVSFFFGLAPFVKQIFFLKTAYSWVILLIWSTANYYSVKVEVIYLFQVLPDSEIFRLIVVLSQTFNISFFQCLRNDLRRMYILVYLHLDVFRLDSFCSSTQVAKSLLMWSHRHVAVFMWMNQVLVDFLNCIGMRTISDSVCKRENFWLSFFQVFVLLRLGFVYLCWQWKHSGALSSKYAIVLIFKCLVATIEIDTHILFESQVTINVIMGAGRCLGSSSKNCRELIFVCKTGRTVLIASSIDSFDSKTANRVVLWFRRLQTWTFLIWGIMHQIRSGFNGGGCSWHYLSFAIQKWFRTSLL